MLQQKLIFSFFPKKFDRFSIFWVNFTKIMQKSKIDRFFLKKMKKSICVETSIMQVNNIPTRQFWAPERVSRSLSAQSKTHIWCYIVSEPSHNITIFGVFKLPLRVSAPVIFRQTPLKWRTCYGYTTDEVSASLLISSLPSEHCQHWHKHDFAPNYGILQLFSNRVCCPRKCRGYLPLNSSTF